MPTFSYTAMRPDGALKESKIDAANADEARLQLKAAGERVMNVKELTSVQVTKQRVKRGKKIGGTELGGAVRQMSILVRAGVPIVEGMRGLAEQSNSLALSEAINDMAEEISHGASLSDAFAKHSNLFPPIAVEMARIAETGGNLAQSLEKLAEYIESAAEIMRKVRSALAYPAVILGISVVTVIVMVTFILPRFMNLFGRMGAEVPWTTSMLMQTGHAMKTYWYAFIGGGWAIGFAAKKWAASESGRSIIDSTLLKLPILGEVVLKVVMGRVVSSMATLLTSGIPMVKTLEISAAAANNLTVKNALLRASEEVSQGESTSNALKQTGAFPPLVQQMVASGEKTGELPTMLQYVSSLYGREVDAKLKALTSIIEPVMIVVLAVIVGFIAMSVIVPIYSLVGGVK